MPSGRGHGAGSVPQAAPKTGAASAPAPLQPRRPARRARAEEGAAVRPAAAAPPPARRARAADRPTTAGPPPATLLSIPLDLLLLILSALPASDLAAASCTCLPLRDAVEGCPHLWRSAFAVRWGETGLAAAADAAADEDEDEEEDGGDEDDWLAAAMGSEAPARPSSTPRRRRRRPGAVWRRRYAAADAAEGGGSASADPLADAFRLAAAARRAAAPPAWRGGTTPTARGAAAAGASPAERVAAWRAGRGLAGGRPAAAASLRSRHHGPCGESASFVRLPGGSGAGPPIFGCEACGWAHICGARRCDAARVDRTSGAEVAVCPLSGLVFDGALPAVAGGGAEVEEGDEEAGGGGGRLGRAFIAGYEGE